MLVAILKSEKSSQSMSRGIADSFPRRFYSKTLRK